MFGDFVQITTKDARLTEENVRKYMQAYKVYLARLQWLDGR
jgi:hypothetical protein